MEKLLIPLPETNFWHDAVKLLMSHSDKAEFVKRYKITILVVTFSFGNGYEIFNMHKIMYDIGDDSKVKLENNGSHYACYVQKTKSHCVTWTFWKWQKN